MLGDQSGDAFVVGFRGRGAEREADFGQAKLEQAIAPAALAVVVPLGRGPREDFDLPVIVSNGVQKGPPIGVEEGPPFQII
ncbi:hypothetical protein GTV57_15855 [Sphingobium xenophagum]|nr:hypothetical protein GTV57_15855 [Sphingobium xenophagum]